MSGVGAVWARFQRSHPWRAWQRYGSTRGPVLAGGMAYFAFFSIFAALAVGFTVFAAVLGNQDDLRDRVIAQLDDLLPGVIAGPGQEGLVQPDVLESSVNLLTTAGVIAAVALLVTALGWLDAMRQGIRAVFEQPSQAGNVVVLKLRDLGVLATLGLAILASVILSLLVNTITSTVLDWIGLEQTTLATVLLAVIGNLVVLAADVVTFMVVLRLLPGVRIPWSHLRSGALFGGIGLFVLKLLGGQLLGGVSNNPLLASAAVLAGLLVWMNFISRLTLLAAAWAATAAQDRGSLPRLQPLPPPPVAAQPIGPRPVTAPTFGARAQDRVAVGAGVVLGLVAGTGLRALRDGVRAVSGATRRARD